MDQAWGDALYMCDLSEASHPFIDSTRIQKVPTQSQALEVRNALTLEVSDEINI